ncbi:MAG: type II toxin-antitoxin system PemK/MazF family toxin [Nitrospira sp.]|nr:type II toxin-antitoxin system PemK/MazF family toxin [Nitrospira sp.]
MVELDPTRGSEIKKTRPSVVVSSDALNRLPIRLIVPITSYQEKYAKRIWAVPFEATSATGLERKSIVMSEQARCVSVERFAHLVGTVPPYVMEEIDAALKIVFDLS